MKYLLLSLGLFILVGIGEILMILVGHWLIRIFGLSKEVDDE